MSKWDVSSVIDMGCMFALNMQHMSVTFDTSHLDVHTHNLDMHVLHARGKHTW